MNYSICKRDGNKKRNFVIVNPALCKHVPSKPSAIKNKLAYRLVGKTLYEDENIFDSERIVVIGFAETATALGYFVADGINKMVTTAMVEYITTTRTRIDGEQYLEFTEQHSHATEQFINTRCLGDKKTKTKFIIVDDEITTGNTVRGLIKCIESCMDKEYITGYDVVSALKSSERTKEVSEIYNLDIKYIALNDISEHDYEDFTFNMNHISGNIENTVDDRKSQTTLHHFDAVKVERFVNLANGGHVSLIDDNESINSIINDLNDKLINVLASKENEKFHIDVIGTEEFMSLPIEVALYLEETLNSAKFNITTHSTTRSPILPMVDTKEQYDIYNRVNIKSVYGDYDTFLYNTDLYKKEGTKVYSVIITDSHPDIIHTGMSQLVDHLKSKGAKDVWVYYCNR